MGYAAAVQAGVSAAVGDFREAVGLGTKAIRFFEHSKFSQVQYLAYPVQLWVHHQLGSMDRFNEDLARWVGHEPHGIGRYKRLASQSTDAVPSSPGWGPGRRLTFMGAGVRLLDAEFAIGSDGLNVDEVVSEVLRVVDLEIVAPAGWPSTPRRICAQLLLGDDRPADATVFAVDAVEQTREAGLLPELALSLLAATECLARTGRTDDARRNVAEAMTLTARLGMRPALKLAELSGLRLSTEAKDPTAESDFRVVLVTDVVNSTLLSVREGDEAYVAAMDSHLELAAAASAGHGGHVFDTAGDSLLAWFESVTDAEAAALSILGDTLAGPHDPAHDVGIRIGLATGYPFQRDQQVYGATVILAARACSEARQNSIYATEDVVRRSSLEYKDEGQHYLKGFPGEPRLFSLG